MGGRRPLLCLLQQPFLLLHELTSQVLSASLGQPSVHFLQPHLSKHSAVPYAVKFLHPLHSFPLQQVLASGILLPPISQGPSVGKAPVFLCLPLAPSQGPSSAGLRRRPPPQHAPPLLCSILTCSLNGHRVTYLTHPVCTCKDPGIRGTVQDPRPCPALSWPSYRHLKHKEHLKQSSCGSLHLHLFLDPLLSGNDTTIARGGFFLPGVLPVVSHDGSALTWVGFPNRLS